MNIIDVPYCLKAPNDLNFIIDQLKKFDNKDVVFEIHSGFVLDMISTKEYKRLNFKYPENKHLYQEILELAKKRQVNNIITIFKKSDRDFYPRESFANSIKKKIQTAIDDTLKERKRKSPELPINPSNQEILIEKLSNENEKLKQKNEKLTRKNQKYKNMIKEFLN